MDATTNIRKQTRAVTSQLPKDLDLSALKSPLHELQDTMNFAGK